LPTPWSVLFWVARMAKIVTLASPEALARHVAGWLTDLALMTPGAFAVALSGGSTPKRLFEIMAEPENAARFPWGRTHLFWGDERCVPHDHPDSNYRMTREALLDHVPLPADQIHPMPTDGEPASAARAYQATLQGYYGGETLDMTRPLFDVVLLGLGENGHTASLFPDTESLTETLAWVVPVTHGVPQPRLTLTYPAIACSRHVAFLVAGASKAHVLTLVLGGDRSQPATRITSAGQVLWFTDEAARPAKG
jgi:6-phosphogluconolactonase